MLNPTIGSILKKYRKLHNMSVDDVSFLLQQKFQYTISNKTIYAWENNQNLPSINTLMILCEIYEIPNITKEYNIIQKEPTPLILSIEEREIILRYRSRNYYNSAIRKLLDLD